ncbi:regulator of ribonuclease activity A [Plasticicumulans lactativorans]|uniref:4-hydroxy-4-methyl-2-oxoglutarate aldolase n=1 Tax=Plasticicumulans lactativorans TaxID=1133106 RepID=A0A4R2KWG2_9GAMM|nr:ribonuclease E activity regulator RraA [Plasticicumulans lactativorans]TCO77342.1 regulator of ribonuclease activity A [Plasticicumulans lactativorans]
MGFKTADLCDDHADKVQIAEPIFGDYGGDISFFGPLSTLKAFEDNSLVRKAFEEPGQGRVLVIDGGGSMRCAMFGDQLAALAEKNGWAGVIVNGCIRDSAAISDTAIGVKALGVHPLKTVKRNEGQRDVVLRFAGVTFTPGHYVYADEDGLLVSAKPLF